MGATATGWLGRRRFDVTAAGLGLLVAIGLFPLRFMSSDILIETIPVVLGLACLSYLVAVRRELVDTATPSLSMSVVGYLPGLVLAGIASLVLVAAIAGQRSVLFYDIAGIVGAMLIVQIVFTDDTAFSPRFILGEVVLFAAVLRLGALYTATSYIGIDIWTHQLLASQIAEAGSLTPIAGDKHYVAPLYHLLVVTTSLFADIPHQAALYLSLGVVMPLATVFVYATTRFLVSTRWAVFAAMLYATADYAIQWGIHLIPTSLGLVFFLGVTYALVRVMQTDYRNRDFLLLVVLSLAVIFTHQISSFVMLVLLGAGVVAQFLLNRRFFQPPRHRARVFGAVGPVNLVGLLVFDLGLLTFTWSFTPYRGDTFLGTVGSFLVSTVTSEAGFLNLANPSTAPGSGAGRAPTLIEQVAAYVDIAGFLLLFGMTVVGSLYVLRRTRAKHAPYMLVAVTAAMAVFVFGLPLFGVRNFVPQRWFAFMYVGMAILAAIGVRFLARKLSARTFVVGMLLIALAFPSVMVMSSNGAIDNPVFSDQRARLGYTATEMAAVQTIGSLTVSSSADVPPERMLYTDHPYRTVYDRTGAARTDTMQIVTGEPVTHDAVVYRAYQSDGASFFRNEDDRGQLRNVPPERVCRPSQSVLYSNGPVRLCVTP